MRTWRIHATLLPVALVIAALLPPMEREFRGQVEGVHDGDTLTVVHTAGQIVKVRLLHVDAPELAQAWGREARDYARQMAPTGDRVTIRWTRRDKYGRILGEVILADGSSLNLGLLKWGHAWGWKDDRHAECRRLEAEAREAGRGLWARDSPEPPWDYRRRIKTERAGAVR